MLRRLAVGGMLCWLAGATSPLTARWDEARVLALFADLPEAFEIAEVIAVEPAALGGGEVARTRFRVRSVEPVERRATGALYLRASLTVQRWRDPEAAAAEAARLRSAADPDTGLSYAWDVVLVRGDLLLHLHADCTFSEATFSRLARRLVEGTGGPAPFEPSFWCRCGGGCRQGAPAAMPRVQHPDGEDELWDNRLDPSGLWRSAMGELALMHTADTLSFAYLATFGKAPHICEGAGVAGLTGTDRYEYVDDQGTLALTLEEDGLRFEVVDGIASFCGAGWSGDRFELDSFEPPQRCRVAVGRATFHVVDFVDPESRPASAPAGASIDGVPAPSSDEAWLLGRLVGGEGTTVGFLRRSEVKCPGEGG